MGIISQIWWLLEWGEMCAKQVRSGVLDEWVSYLFIHLLCERRKPFVKSSKGVPPPLPCIFVPVTTAPNKIWLILIRFGRRWSSCYNCCQRYRCQRYHCKFVCSSTLECIQCNQDRGALKTKHKSCAFQSMQLWPQQSEVTTIITTVIFTITNRILNV